MKSTKVKVSRRKIPVPLSLAERVAFLESFVGTKFAIAKPLAPIGAPGAVRYTKLGTDGKPTSGDHVAVLDSKTGLVWDASPALGGKELNHSAAMKACTDVRLLGQKDWRAPTVEELLTIIDYTKNDPAVNKEFFKGPYGWTWTSTPYAADSGFAWYVGLHYGYSGWLRQHFENLARAVRAGQQLGIGI